MATIKSDPFPARPTRYKELGYRKDGPMLWRICDLTGERAQAIGAHYATKAELLADLDRYAAEYGCDGTTHAAPSPAPRPREPLDDHDCKANGCPSPQECNAARAELKADGFTFKPIASGHRRSFMEGVKHYNAERDAATELQHAAALETKIDVARLRYLIESAEVCGKRHVTIDLDEARALLAKWGV